MKFNNSAFARFFRYFPKLFSAGLLYSVPLAVFVGIFILIGYLTGLNNIILWGLGIIPAAPMLAGLVMVIRKIAIEKTDVRLFDIFLTAVKENLKAFLLHGVVMYLIISCTFFSLLYYGSLARTDIVYGYILTIYVLFTAILLIMMFYIPIMSVTYELRMWDIYKNSFLLVFGKILRNLSALALVLIVSLAAFSAIVFLSGVWLWVVVAVIVLLYPLLFFYITISVISKGLQDAVGSFTNPLPSDSDDSEEVKEAICNAASDSDYVYVNGKMIKVDKNK
ncbi:MAG: DUF624 domain-containing protein [Ruminococcus sp.]|nr:DUF624 domain-containing protein [Ruminococcus sp.]